MLIFSFSDRRRLSPATKTPYTFHFISSRTIAYSHHTIIISLHYILCMKTIFGVREEIVHATTLRKPQIISQCSDFFQVQLFISQWCWLSTHTIHIQFFSIWFDAINIEKNFKLCLRQWRNFVAVLWFFSLSFLDFYILLGEILRNLFTVWFTDVGWLQFGCRHDLDVVNAIMRLSHARMRLVSSWRYDRELNPTSMCEDLDTTEGTVWWELILHCKS